MNEDIYFLVVNPDLPCNGCNKPARAGVAFKNGLYYEVNMISQDCAIYLSKVYSGEIPFDSIGKEPIPMWDYPKQVSTDVELECYICGEKTHKSCVMRNDTEYPHYMLFYAYCDKHESEIRQKVG